MIIHHDSKCEFLSRFYLTRKAFFCQERKGWLTEGLESFEYEEWLYALAGRMGVEADCSSVEAFCNSNIFEMPLNPDALETFLNGCKDKEEFVEEFVIMLEEGEMALFDY